jgi:hypothetical protein
LLGSSSGAKSGKLSACHIFMLDGSTNQLVP